VSKEIIVASNGSKVIAIAANATSAPISASRIIMTELEIAEDDVRADGACFASSVVEKLVANIVVALHDALSAQQAV
jgi:hypothetical protein